MRFGAGLAVGSDLSAAAEQAAGAALAELPHERPNLVSVFVCGDDPDAVALAGERATAVCGAEATLGCSAAGVIGGGQGVEATRAVSVWVAAIPGARIRTFHLEVVRTEHGLAVIGLPEVDERDSAAWLLADPYSFPADAFVERVNRAGPELPVLGGLAVGVTGPRSTRLFIDGRTVDRGAVGVLLGGVAVHPLVSQGCRPVGPAMTVTQAEGNLILELAGKPALPKLEEVVAALPPIEQALVTTGLQLGIAADEYADRYEQGDFLIRGIVGADRQRAGLVVGDVVEVGRTVRFQVRDADSAGRDLVAQLGRLRAAVPGQLAGALLATCNGRGAALFPTADHDPSTVQRELGPLPLGGFFAAGEFGPVSGRNHVHGFTATMLAFPTGKPAD